MLLIRFMLWNSGNYDMNMLLVLWLNVVCISIWLCSRLLWDIIMFFGVFVDLDVYCRKVRLFVWVLGFIQVVVWLRFSVLVRQQGIVFNCGEVVRWLCNVWCMFVVVSMNFVLVLLFNCFSCCQCLFCVCGVYIGIVRVFVYRYFMKLVMKFRFELQSRIICLLCLLCVCSYVVIVWVCLFSCVYVQFVCGWWLFLRNMNVVCLLFLVV